MQAVGKQAVKPMLVRAKGCHHWSSGQGNDAQHKMRSLRLRATTLGCEDEARVKSGSGGLPSLCPMQTTD